MKVKQELFEDVAIFTISGDISSEYEDNLKLTLMKAVHGVRRAVLNFRGVNRINRNCLKLLNKAYCTSLRLNNPIIMTEVPETYLPEIFSCKSINKEDSIKDGILSGVI